ncbi:putative hexosyltransferase [Helianthus annuus]|nr:putative hexosyltransferase [Helianthus annuus]KAJ0632053.1 putative hexosyltransferase [Helianthus annuus]
MNMTRKYVCALWLDSTPNHDYAILLDSTIGQVLEGFWCTYPGLRVETLGCDSKPSHDNSRRTSGTRDRQGLDLRLHDLDSRLDSRPLRLRLLTGTTRDQKMMTRDLLVATRDRVFSSRDRLVSTGLPTLVIGPQCYNTVAGSWSVTPSSGWYSAGGIWGCDNLCYKFPGIRETFGRVTIEAMAFGIPVLGTDAGGTKETVEHNVTGLLHPIGHPGTPVLSKHLRYLLKNPSERQRLGLEGREKVKKMYFEKAHKAF